MLRHSDRFCYPPEIFSDTLAIAFSCRRAWIGLLGPGLVPLPKCLAHNELFRCQGGPSPQGGVFNRKDTNGN